MSKTYGKMMDDAFGKYYERFRKLNALSKEGAVRRKELFPEGESLIDTDRMHKMLSAGIVKRVGFNKYWLDENRAANGNDVLKQRLLILGLALLFGILLVVLEKFGIIS